MSDNPFALSNIQLAGGERETDSNPFALNAIARDQGQDQRVELQRAVRVNPDQAAEVERLAQRYPAPKDVLLRNLQDVQLQAAVDKADETLRTSPKLAQYMRDNPWAAKQSHDDLGTLAQIEQFFVDTGGSMKAGVYNASKGAAGVFRAGAELLAPALDSLESVPEVGGNPLRRLAEGFDMLAQQNTASAKAAAPKTTGILDSGFQSGVQSLTQNLLALPMAFLPGGQGAALGMMTASTGGQSYQDARDKGLPMSQALPFAAAQASIEWATEKLPLGQLLGDVKAGTAFYKMIAKQIALEVPGEQVATVLQDLNEWAVLNPEKPFSSYLEERPSAAAQTLVATIVGAGGNVAVVKGIETALSRGAKGAQQVDQAERGNAALQSAMQTAAASKLRERNPDTFKQLIQQMADETDGAPSSVFINAQVLAQSGINVSEVFPSVAEQMDAALATNGSVEVPIGDVLAAAPGTPLEQLFLQNARATADGLSIAEAKQASDQAGEFLKSEADRVLADAQDQQAWQQSADTVKATLLEQLNTAGRFTSDVNDAYSTLVRDFYSVMASRQGVTPEELYAKYPLRVAAGGQSAARLDQQKQVQSLRDAAVAARNAYAEFEKAVQAGQEPDADQYFALSDAVNAAEGELATALEAIPDDGFALQGTTSDGRMLMLNPSAQRPGHYQLTRFATDGSPWGDTQYPTKKQAIRDFLDEAETSTVKDFGGQLNQSPTTQPLPATVNVDGKERPTTNSKGQHIAATVEGVENFWRWFGDSKVVDGQGKPLVVYHGTTADVEAFDPSQANDRMYSGGTENTVFFTDNPDVAASYAGRRTSMTGLDATFSEGGNLSPVYLKISKPLKANAKGENWRDVQYKGEFYSTAELTEVAKSAKKDGMIVAKVLDYRDSGVTGDKTKKPSTTYAVFSPTQIKSATGNRGMFDPQDANILNQSAFHGTPHRGITQFSTDKIGTGEGNQAFGWGLYFASKKEVAESYREKLSGSADQAPRRFFKGNELEPGTPEYHAARLVESTPLAKARKDVAAWIKDADTWSEKRKADPSEQRLLDGWERTLDVLNEATGKGDFAKKAAQGQLYEVEIPEDSDMLLFDKPITSQPDAVKKVLKDSGLWKELKDNLDDYAAPMNTRGKLKGENIYNYLAWKLGSEKAASLRLLELGIPGLKYPGGTIAGVKNAGYNYVIFSGDDVAITNQFYQNQQQAARGTFSPDQLLLTLNENADLSTFLHESGHFFLEMMADMASQPNAPADVQDDMNRLLKWFGVANTATWNAMTLDQKRPHHERFAESFEQYLLEGKAPNAELQPLFRRFRAWMVNVYKSLTQFMRGRNLKLSDEVRQVFDRMLATDEQIREAEQAAGLLPDFDATNEAIEALQARSLRDLKWTVNARSRALKALQKEAKLLRKAVEDEVRAEVEAMPEVKAKAALDGLRKSTPEYKAALTEWNAQRKDVLEKAAEDIKNNLLATEGAGLKGLDKGQFIAKNKRRIANEAEARALEWERGNAKPARTMVGSDLDIAMVADQTGYATVEEMLQAIDQFGDKAAAIEGMTDQRMLENFGELATPEAIAEAANDAVHNEARARSLATELKAQADALNPREQTGTASNGRAITVNALTKAAKEFAQNLAARRRIKDLKAATAQHRATEARAAKMWQDATTKGKTQEAVQAKRDQMLNHFTVRAMQDAQAEVKKIREFFSRVTKDGNEKLVDKGRDPDVVNAMRAILAAYDVAPRLEKGALEYMDTVSRNDPAMYAALQPSVQGALMNAKPLGEMTMEELRGLNDELRAMWHLAKRSRQMEVDGNLLDIEDAADELMTRMEAVGIPLTVPGETGAITVGEEAGIKLQFAKAILSRVEQWAERMDGKFGGPFLRLVFQPIKDAADRYRTDKTAYRKEFTKLVEAVAPSLKPGVIDAPELGYKFGQGKDGGTAELLHAVLHTGNESNKRKLLLGRGWATESADGTMDTSKWDAFMQRMHDTGGITKAHYDFAQGVWDLLERMKPLAQETHRKVYGRYFAEVTADSFDTPFGPYRGGYVPAQTDSRLVKDAKLRELAEGENESLAYAFPSSPSGFTKARVEYNKPLLLDLRALAQHMDKVLLFSHMQGAVTDVRRLLTDKRVSYALDRIQPGAYEGMLIPWLNRSAKQIVETPVAGDRKLSRFLSTARSRAGMALMFANLSNTAQQITGFSTAAVKVKPGLLISALASFTASPKAMRESVVSASEFMRDRMQNEVSALNNVVEEILIEPNLLERGQAWTQKHAYFMQSAVDNTMAPIIWTAAYNQATGEKLDHKEAVRFADGVVRQTQGTTLPEDVSRFETGPAMVRMFTQFIGYFNMMANTNATGVKQIADDMGLRKGAGKLAYVALAGLLAPIWVAEAIAQAFKGGPDDEDRDGWLDDWLMAVFGVGTLKGVTAMVPIVGQGAQLAVNRFNSNPADDKFSLSPAVSLIESAVSAPASVYAAIVDDGKVQKAVRDVASLATMVTGLPFYAVARPVGYTAGVAAGQIEPTSEVDAVRGVLTGNASAESKR